MHDILYLLALLILLALPALLALQWGDRLAEAWDRRRLRQRQRRRSRIPLPQGQDDLLADLRVAEERREDIDLQISERLLDLQRLTVCAWKQHRSGSASDLLTPAETLENLYARKEEALSLLLDVACLQSDRIDAMAAEVDALSQALGGSPMSSAERVPSQQDVPARQGEPTTAAEHLLRRIEEAGRRRRTIDERLRQMKSWKPPNRSPRPPSPPAPDAGAKGSHLDITIQ